ncbi:MAG: hypothetical protein LBE08_12480, partial [Bifidobacteriaceae bacterium]|nr:hypothetical protein [Bifidobacteriaceae bacterium]
RAWRVAGLLTAPFAACYLPAAALGQAPATSASTTLWAGLAGVAFALIAALGRKVEAARQAAAGRPERALLAVAGACGLAQASLVAIGGWDEPVGAIVWLALAFGAVALGQEQRGGWLPFSGVALVLAASNAAYQLSRQDWIEAWSLGLFGGLALWAACAGATRWPAARAVTGPLAAGAFGGLMAISLPTLVLGLGAPTSARLAPMLALGWAVPAAAVALTGLVRAPAVLRRIGSYCVLPLGAACLAGWAVQPAVPVWLGLATLATAAFGLSGVATGALLAPTRRPRFAKAVTATGRVTSLALALPATLLVLGDDPLTATAALVVPAMILANGFALRPRSWPYLSGAACLAFVVLGGAALASYFPQLETTHLLAIIFALAAAGLTPARRPALPTWSVLGGAAWLSFAVVAFDLVIERTWTGAAAALAATIMSLMAALTRRRRLPLEVKAAAAAGAVGASALTMVAVLALVTPGSGSIWLFPLVACVASGAALGGVGLRARARLAPARPEQPTAPAGAGPGSGPGPGRAAPAAVRPAVGAAARAPDAATDHERERVGLTLIVSGAALGAAAVLMAVAWPVVGATTVLATAALLCAASAGVAAARAGLQQAWWYTGATACAVLWSALVWGDIGLVEAYTLPPALAAATIGGWLARRRRNMLALAIPGAWLAVAPSLLLLLVGSDPLLRGFELAAMGLLALTLATAFEHLRRALALAALGPAAGLAALALMIGQAPPFPGDLAALGPLTAYPSALFALTALVGLMAAAAVAAAGGLFAASPAKTRGWVWCALALAALAPVLSVRFTWFVVAGMWLAMAGYLALTLIAARAQAAPDRVRSGLAAKLAPPPFWSIWLLALAVGIAGWSTRELRVEVFALPLGLNLFAAGLIAKHWLGAPAWAVTPGVAATLGPSTLAVGTDPMTWRAILVLALALGFMVFGALRAFRPPTFVAAGSIAVTVFEVFARSGHISAVPWLASLLAGGGCLLALSIYFELRSRRHAKNAAAGGQNPPPDARTRSAGVF